MEIKTERDLETLVRRYQEPLLRYCTGITGNREDAEDVVQTAFIKAWMKRDSQRKSGSLKSWLFRIAYTASVDFLRARRRTNELPDSLAEQAAKGRDPGISDEMRAALASLSVLDRAIVEERILMEMSYEEMADIHHLPAAALRKRYSRARQKLQKLLAKEEHHA